MVRSRPAAYQRCFGFCLLLALALTAPAAAEQGRELASVVRVVDGDTVEVRVGGRVEKLRLIGLNTPETVDARRPVECFGREASAYAKQFLPRGLRAGLEADPTQGDRDRYARLPRYTWLPDGRNFAEVMISEGYGFEYTYRLPYRYQDRFQAAQREARAAGRGLWAAGACEGRPRSCPRRPALFGHLETSTLDQSPYWGSARSWPRFRRERRRRGCEPTGGLVLGRVSCGDFLRRAALPMRTARGLSGDDSLFRLGGPRL